MAKYEAKTKPTARTADEFIDCVTTRFAARTRAGSTA